MKNLILTICFIFGTVQFTNSQVNFGIKAGVNYNKESIKNFKYLQNEYANNTEGKLGHHAGIWLRVNIPVIGLYVQPELVYTSLKSEIQVTNLTLKSDYNLQKFDVPILLGKKLFKFLHAYAGPSFQYIIDGKLTYDKTTKIKTNDFTTGFQLGTGLELGKLGIDIRWEREFSEQEKKIISTNTNTTLYTFDTRINQIILGLSYRF